MNNRKSLMRDRKYLIKSIIENYKYPVRSGRKRMMLKSIEICVKRGKIDKLSKRHWRAYTAKRMAQELHDVLLFWGVVWRKTKS